MLRPGGEAPPSWHTLLDYTGLFLFYFAGTLAALLLVVRCWQAIAAESSRRETSTAAMVVLTTLLAAAPLFVDAPAMLSLTLEGALAISVLALVVAGLGKRRDLGIQVGLAILAVPLLLHTVNALGARFFWPDNMFDGPG